MIRTCCGSAIATILISTVVAAERTKELERRILFASGFEPGEPAQPSAVYRLVQDPWGKGGQVLLGEVGATNTYRLFSVPFSGLAGRTVHVSFKACSPDGVRAAVVLNQNDRRERVKLIERLSEKWQEFNATVRIDGHAPGAIEIVAPSSWGAPPGKAYLDEIRVIVDGDPAL